MDIILFAILLIFAIALFLVGFFKNQLVVILFCGVAFMTLGMFALNGIEYVSSTSITTNNVSVTTVVNNYSTWNHSLGNSSITVNYALGFLFALFGLFMVIVSSVAFFKKKVKLDMSSDDSDSGSDS